jgi:hypothetical protein
MFPENAKSKYHAKFNHTDIFKAFLRQYISDNFHKTIHQSNIHNEKIQKAIHTNSSDFQNHSTMNGKNGSTNHNHIISKTTVTSIVINGLFIFIS